MLGGGEREEKEEVNVLKLDMDEEVVFMHTRAKFQDNRNSIVNICAQLFSDVLPSD